MSFTDGDEVEDSSTDFDFSLQRHKGYDAKWQPGKNIGHPLLSDF